jgi:hypothetical protein
MQHCHTPSSIIVVVAFLLAGCFLSLEQRWEAFDEQIRQEIGVKTKNYYVSEWGNPTKRVNLQTADRPGPGSSGGMAAHRAGIRLSPSHLMEC